MYKTTSTPIRSRIKQLDSQETEKHMHKFSFSRKRFSSSPLPLTKSDNLIERRRRGMYEWKGGAEESRDEGIAEQNP